MMSKSKKTLEFEAKVEEKEIRSMNNQLKKDTQVVTNEELEKLLPIMAGKPIDEETTAWVDELMKREVTLGSVVQVVAMMLAPTKESLLSNQYTMLDTQDVFKRTLIGEHIVTEEDFNQYANEIVKERDEAREKAQKLVKEELNKAK